MSAAFLGVTPPVSLMSAGPKEIELNNLLIKELKSRGSFESESATLQRVNVLNSLQQMAEEFVYNVSKKKNMSDGMSKDAGGKIFTFGSYRLGVYGPGSDIDALVVVPKHVTRLDFFEGFIELLEKRPEVEEIAAVPDAFVPLIGLKFSGISIDLLFARLDVSRVPRNLLLDNKDLLRNIEEKDLRSLNGTRVTDDILTLVPKPTVFKHALRCIKMWAQQRAIYGNVFGFPGGVAWAMLVARICQLYPNTVGAVIVEKFFQIYSQWNWPQPVLLKKIEDGPLQVRVWNPRLYIHDRQHKMPVITPAYPSMCATHNIMRSTKEIVLKELRRGVEIMNLIHQGNANWGTLLERHTFFHDYRFYLCIVACTRGTSAEHLKYSGLIESKIRILVQKLEFTEGIALAHPYVKSFGNDYHYEGDEESSELIEAYGTLLGEATIETIKKKHEAEGDDLKGKEIHFSKIYIGLVIEEGHKKLDIQNPCSDFFSICKNWPDYDDSKHAVKIKNVKLHDLPNDVYVEGEERPLKTTKRKKGHTKSDSIKRLKNEIPTGN